MTVRTVRAAGGVVWRRRGETIEVLVVHRPAYDDWSLPKGKAEGEEPDEECALREVEEETGVRCDVVAFLASNEYVDRKGRPKVVRWYEMSPRQGSEAAVPDSDAEVPEIDAVKWLPVDDALALLTYEHDRRLVAQVAARAAGREE